ncbi:MAG: peptide-methionine (R)-S-oxide reductase MsrB [Bdellovibrionales bacterium]|nr:peptide-methionine (R)-S-oxide reductase MsrB [Bdellovibrionales bacterium]
MKIDKQKEIEKLKKENPKAYRITQEGDTEAPFQNEYHDNKREGIYVDVVTGRPLFSSNEKYDSGSGWPSFYDVIDQKNIETKTDLKLVRPRTEIHSVDNTHLGHVFTDGPKDKTGLRYCVNSASLKFIPKEELNDPKHEGQYKEFVKLFENQEKKK